MELNTLLDKIADFLDDVDGALAKKDRDETFYPTLVGTMLGHMLILQDKIRQMQREAA